MFALNGVTPNPITLTIQTSTNVPVVFGMSIYATNGVILSWNDPSTTLQSSPTVNGVYSNVLSGEYLVGSPYTNVFTGQQTFYRTVR